MNEKHKALAWWESLPLYQSNDLERKYGYFGHDIGTTENEIYYMWIEEGKPLPLPEEDDVEVDKSIIWSDKDMLKAFLEGVAYGVNNVASQNMAECVNWLNEYKKQK